MAKLSKDANTVLGILKESKEIVEHIIDSPTGEFTNTIHMDVLEKDIAKMLLKLKLARYNQVCESTGPR